MSATKVNLNGIQELDLTLGGTTTVTMPSPGVVAVTQTLPPTNTHDEPLTDGNANFIFAATLTTGGDIIVVTGVPN
jgi:hypothetical protein